MKVSWMGLSLEGEKNYIQKINVKRKAVAQIGSHRERWKSWGNPLVKSGVWLK